MPRQHPQEATVVVAGPRAHTRLHGTRTGGVQPAALDRKHPVAHGVTHKEVSEPVAPPSSSPTSRSPDTQLAEGGQQAGVVEVGELAQHPVRHTRTVHGHRAGGRQGAGSQRREPYAQDLGGRHGPPPRGAHGDQLLEEERAPLGTLHDVGGGDGVQTDPGGGREVSHEHRRIGRTERLEGQRRRQPTQRDRQRGPLGAGVGIAAIPVRASGRDHHDARRRLVDEPGQGRERGHVGEVQVLEDDHQGAYGGEPPDVPGQQVGSAPIGADARSRVQVRDQHREVGKCRAGRARAFSTP